MSSSFFLSVFLNLNKKEKRIKLPLESTIRNLERMVIMQIAICDDEYIFRNELRALLVKYKKSRRLQLDIYEFASGEEFLSSELTFDIVFLDYQMPSLNGMQTARKLRTKNSLCSIVFITNYPDFVFDSFEVCPYRFFKKPISDSRIELMLDSYITQQRMLAPIIVNNYDGQKIIPSKNVVYLEGDGKYCTIRTIHETVHSSKTLAGVLELLPQYCFYRVHKSYAVNMYHIDQILENNQVLLLNGEKVLVGRNKVAEFKRSYRAFIKNYYLKV